MVSGIDGVVPLLAADSERFVILLRSLDANFPSLRKLWVVVPDSEIDDVRRRLSRTAISQQRLRLLPENRVVPELPWFPWVKRWRRQQLIKLAMADHVETDFYVTFDADVICVAPVERSDLVRGGRAVYSSMASPIHEDWYARSAAMLGLPLRRPLRSHGVTPAVLSRDAVRELAAYLDGKVARRDLSAGWRGWQQRLLTGAFRHKARLAPWRLYLAASRGWTEYASYFSFLEAAGRLDAYHVEGGCLYSRGDSIWRRDAPRFDAWDPGPLFQRKGPPFFVIVQSKAGIEPPRVWEKVEPYLRGARSVTPVAPAAVDPVQSPGNLAASVAVGLQPGAGPPPA